MEKVVYLEGTNEDFIILIEAANKYEGWTHSSSDFDALKKALGDNVLLMVAKTRSGDFIGSCMSLVLDGAAFVGYYFVMPQYRGKGIGKRLFNSILTKSMENMNVGLHSALKMSPIYDRCYGFSHYSEWSTAILQISDVLVDKIKVPSDDLLVKKANEVPFIELCNYHRNITNSRGEDFIRFTAVYRDDTICKVVVHECGKIVGFGRARQSSNGALIIGPIYCNSDNSFVALFKSLIESYSEVLCNSAKITMRSPSMKTAQISSLLDDAVKIVEVSRLQPQFTKYVPQHDVTKIYAITDLFVFV